MRSLLLRIEEVNERSWQSALASQIHFSEMMLYGAYIDGVLGGSEATTSSMNCVAYSDESPLSLPEISRLLRTGNTNTQAVMISAKAGIPYEIRSQALRDYEDYLSHGRGKVIGGPR